MQYHRAQTTMGRPQLKWRFTKLASFGPLCCSNPRRSKSRKRRIRNPAIEKTASKPTEDTKSGSAPRSSGSRQSPVARVANKQTPVALHEGGSLLAFARTLLLLLLRSVACFRSSSAATSIVASKPAVCRRRNTAWRRTQCVMLQHSFRVILPHSQHFKSRYSPPSMVPAASSCGVSVKIACTAMANHSTDRCTRARLCARATSLASRLRRSSRSAPMVCASDAPDFSAHSRASPPSTGTRTEAMGWPRSIPPTRPQPTQPSPPQ
mmetsp:Transcript_4927/g.17217  ORF Transcript_4927/g.17217 Transcript_4927/m.17217 type:complete len:265 (-) Transcript_4927:125-919(-)